MMMMTTMVYSSNSWQSSSASCPPWKDIRQHFRAPIPIYHWIGKSRIVADYSACHHPDHLIIIIAAAAAEDCNSLEIINFNFNFQFKFLVFFHGVMIELSEMDGYLLLLLSTSSSLVSCCGGWSCGESCCFWDDKEDKDDRDMVSPSSATITPSTSSNCRALPNSPLACLRDVVFTEGLLAGPLRCKRCKCLRNIFNEARICLSTEWKRVSICTRILFTANDTACVLNSDLMDGRGQILISPHVIEHVMKGILRSLAGGDFSSWM